MSTLYTRVGVDSAADGSTGYILRTTKTGSLVVDQLHGRRHEQSSRGNLFTATIGTGGVAPGTTFDNAPPFALYNAPNSGILGSVVKTSCGILSGTLGVGSLFHCYNPSQQTTPSSGTALTTKSTNGSGATGIIKAFTGSTVSATVTAYRVAAGIGATNPWVSPVQEDVDGEFVIPQGSVYALQGVTAAGTSPLVFLAATWEEIPVL